MAKKARSVKKARHAKKAGNAKAPGDMPLRRNCGTMAVHMMLLEQFTSYRARQLKLEQDTAKRRAAPP